MSTIKCGVSIQAPPQVIPPLLPLTQWLPHVLSHVVGAAR